MNKKKVFVVALVLMILVQLLVPASMIWDSEQVLEEGEVIKLKTKPIDPTDPFRGKYITLSFEEDSWFVDDKRHWERDQTIYVSFVPDQDGYAIIDAVSKSVPVSGVYVKAKVRYSFRSQTIRIKYPFERYYMEESKAYDAERAHRKARADTSQVTYALISIHKGDAVLRDVLINDCPIREIVEDMHRESSSD